MSADRDRVTAILTLAEADAHYAGPSTDLIRAYLVETPWLARRLLEALDTIDKARDDVLLLAQTCQSLDRWRPPTLTETEEAGLDLARTVLLAQALDVDALNGGTVSDEGSQQ